MEVWSFDQTRLAFRRARIRSGSRKGLPFGESLSHVPSGHVTEREESIRIIGVNGSAGLQSCVKIASQL